jgi:hypothetical protein
VTVGGQALAPDRACRSQTQCGLLLSAWKADHRAIFDAVRAHYPGIELAGLSSAGGMSSVLGREDSVALAVFAPDAIAIVVGLSADLSDA